MEKISQIHGLTLSAWAIAGLTGNNTSELILYNTNSYSNIIGVGFILYFVALGICIFLVNKKAEI
jgi:OFA family oxalate/formate antiporter-like MFS transporter